MVALVSLIVALAACAVTLLKCVLPQALLLVPPAQWLRSALVHWPAMGDESAPAFVTDMPKYLRLQQPQAVPPTN